MSDEMAAEREAEIEKEKEQVVGPPGIPSEAQVGEIGGKKEAKPEHSHEQVISILATELTNTILAAAKTIGDAMVIANMVRDNVQFHAVTTLVHNQMMAALQQANAKKPNFKGGNPGWLRQKMGLK